MATPKALLQRRKILLLGDSKTGKHCYVARLIYNKFPHDSSTNVSISFIVFFINPIYYRKNLMHQQQKLKLMMILKFQYKSW